MEPRFVGERVLHGGVQAKPPRLCDHEKWLLADVVECAFGIDVRRWQRDGHLTTGAVFLSHWLIEPTSLASVLVRVESGDRVQLSYRIRLPGRRWKRVELSVCLDWVSCNYGGRRAWFTCPGPDCHRRVTVLYLSGRNRIYFDCRRCAGLRYASEYGEPRRRLIRKAQKIRKQLGGSESLLEPFPGKPARVRWDKYERLWREAEEAELQSLPRLTSDPAALCISP